MRSIAGMKWCVKGYDENADEVYTNVARTGSSLDATIQHALQRSVRVVITEQE